MTRADTLEEALRLVADGERVIVTINGVEVGMIPADEVAEIEAAEDRHWNEAAEAALAEGGETIALDDYLKERASRHPTGKTRRSVSHNRTGL